MKHRPVFEVQTVEGMDPEHVSVWYGTEDVTGQRDYWPSCTMDTVSEIANVPVNHVARLVQQAIEAHVAGKHGAAILSPPDGLSIEAAYGQGFEVKVTVKGVKDEVTA